MTRGKRVCKRRLLVCERRQGQEWRFVYVLLLMLRSSAWCSSRRTHAFAGRLGCERAKDRRRRDGCTTTVVVERGERWRRRMTRDGLVA